MYPSTRSSDPASTRLSSSSTSAGIEWDVDLRDLPPKGGSHTSGSHTSGSHTAELDPPVASALAGRDLRDLPPKGGSHLSVLPKGEVEPSAQSERRRRAAGDDARHAVIPEPRRASKHEGVAGFEQQRLHRIAAP